MILQLEEDVTYSLVYMPQAVDPVLHRRHDLFNIVALPIIIYFLIIFLTAYRTNIYAPFTNVCAIGEVYFLIDTVWLLLFPRSVSSPNVIIGHHFIAALGWYCPMWEPSLAGYVAACLLVEVNTFFLIGKRYFANIAILKIPFKVCFHVTWVILRVLMYPIIVYVFAFEAIEHTRSLGSIVNIFALGWVLVASLTLLNFKWTYDLYYGKIESSRKTGL